MYYFTKWIEDIPTRQVTHTMIMEFLVSNMLSRFGCPRRIVTDNAKAFTSNKLVKFCSDYNIIVSHSTTYYPQGNVLVESLNKSLVRIIKKLLKDNKKAWHTKLKFSLWVDRVSTKRSIGTSPFQLVYDIDVVFPASLGILVRKFMQEKDVESNLIQRRINQLVKVQQIRVGVFDKAHFFKTGLRIFLIKTLRWMILSLVTWF